MIVVSVFACVRGYVRFLCVLVIRVCSYVSMICACDCFCVHRILCVCVSLMCISEVRGSYACVQVRKLVCLFCGCLYFVCVPVICVV